MIQICDHKLLIFNLLLMSVVECETEILTFAAHEGGKVEIRCPYESRYETNNKYLCRGECLVRHKDIPVESGSAAKDERFSLTDDRSTHIFTVTITDLRTDDEGQYWCAVKTGYLQLDDYREILLEIKPVSVVSGVTGRHLKIICSYERDLKNNVKLICKGSDPSLCETSGIKVSSEKNINGRFSLRDDKSAVFTVTITDLTLEDSGIYWCGAVERGQKNKNKWISVTNLNIYDVTSERTSPKPTTTASKHSTKPASEDGASIRPVTSSTSSLPLPPSSSSSVTSPSPKLQLGTYSVTYKYLIVQICDYFQMFFQGFTTVVMPSVMVILMVFGFSLFIYFRLRQKREGVQIKGVVHVSAENLLTEEATHTVCHYEEIICTNNPAGYSLGLPMFGEHDASDTLTYSTVIYQTTDHSDRTLLGQELWAIVSP